MTPGPVRRSAGRLAWTVAACLLALTEVGAQVAPQPQRGRLSTSMKADSIAAWSLRGGPVVVPAGGGEAFEQLGLGFGARAGVGVRFANDIAIALTGAWSRLDDDLSGGSASQVDATLELLWSRGSGRRFEVGPVVGLTRLDRDDLAEAATGGLAGAGLRVWQSMGPALEAGLLVDALWVRFGDLALDGLPPDPDGGASGFRPAVALQVAVRVGG